MRTASHGAGRLLTTSAAVLLVVTGASARASGMIGAQDAEWEVLEVVRAFNDAFAANDPDTYFGFIDDEIVVLTPSNPYRVEGIADDREKFEWGLRTGRSRIGYFQEIQPLVRVYGDVDIVTYYSRGAYGPDERVAYLKETDVLVRRDEGWKVVHIHASSTTS